MQFVLDWIFAVADLPALARYILYASGVALGAAIVGLLASAVHVQRKRRAATPETVENTGGDPARTIAVAVRDLRVRYIAVICVLAVLGALFVGGAHQANSRFSDATSMAVLVAKATETTGRTAATAREMAASEGLDPKWTEQALAVHADALDSIIADMSALWQRLDDDLKDRLAVETPYGTVAAIGLLEDFRAEVADAAEGGADERVMAGKYLDGTIDFLVRPALAQQAEALRAFNREAADTVKVTVNIVGAIVAGFAAAILFFIFLPMERSIRAALAKLKTAVEGAKAADHAKTEFLANMSHEIRTPMNGIMGMAELMMHTELDARQKTYNDVIVKSGNALLTIINDILDFSKIDAGHTELEPAPFDLNETVEDVATIVSTRAAEKNLELIVRVDPELPAWAVGDAGRIRQILTNLASNAVKFTEAGHVLIEAARDGGAILFKVADTGIGISEDKLAGVFDKFSQVDSSSTRRHEGTGLGLAIAARLVELMGGTIGAESTVGAGSTFHFRIPLQAHEAPASAERAVAADIEGARILVVDDNAVNRDILTEQARHLGFDACAVESGEMALEFLGHAAAINAPVDLVVLDYQMPGMNGAAALRRIRGAPELAATPVVLLTSVDHRVAVRELKTAGAHAILTKPARSSLLVTTIAEELRKAQRGEPTPMPQAPPHGNAESAASAEAAPPPSAHGERVASAPAEQTPDAPVELAVPSEPAPAAEAALDILVAEDNDVNQLVFSQILGGLDHSFAIVADGRQAVEAWRERSPALILMDVSMPRMSGLEATQRIREAEAAEGLPRTPIIGLTAHALKGDRERCLEASMDDYLAKPVSPDSLAAKIAERLPSANAERLASA